MRCREIQELLPEYSAEALSRLQMRRVREHLGGCAPCAGEFTSLESVLRAVEQWGAVEPPPGLWDGVHRQIASETRLPARPGMRSWWAGLLALPAAARLAPAALAAAAAAALFFGFGSRTETTRPVPDPGHRRPISIANEPEMVAAVQQHSLASAGLFLADRAGFESVVQIVRGQGEIP